MQQEQGQARLEPAIISKQEDNNTKSEYNVLETYLTNVLRKRSLSMDKSLAKKTPVSNIKQK